MQIKTITDGSAFKAAGFQNAGVGGKVTSPVVLTGNPVLPAQAAPKQYIDDAVNLIPAEKLTTGTLPIAQIGAFTGDVVKPRNSAVIGLMTTGVSADTYNNVTVDSKGRVSAGLALAAADIPPLSFSKFTVNKPTTAAGYGITDAVNDAGDTLTGYLSLSKLPTANLHAASKTYTDTKLASISKYRTGDVMPRPSVSTPSGFLRCNGGEANMVTYSALYSVIGETYSVRTMPGNGQPWRQQYQFNSVQNTDITGWALGTALPAVTYEAQAIVTENRAYLLGGNGTSTVYTAPINANGTLGTWTAGTALPGALSASQAIVTVNRVYLLGGLVGTTSVATVYTAPINADGTLGAWTTGTALPTPVAYSHAFATKSRVYLLGGYAAGVGSATVYTAPINADGTLGTWTTDAVLPMAIYAGAMFVTKNRVYLSYGGYVYNASINTDGTLGAWGFHSSLPGVLAYSQAIVTQGRVYLLGGFNNTANIATVYTAVVYADGSLSAWSTATSIYAGLRESQVIVTSSKVYLLGGVDAAGAITSSVQVASFNGGLNDYSLYYAGTIMLTSANNFTLPDFTTKETGGMYYFIKT